MPNPVTAGASFRAGLRTEALATYQRHYEAVRQILSLVMDEFPSDKRSEFYFYWESAPHIARWAYGDTMTEESFRGIQYEIVNHRWAKAIAWQSDDRADDQTRSLMDQARGLGQSAADIDERVFFQILQGTADSELLPTIPNAPDGSALYITTTRFGLAAGNSATITESTEAGVRAGFFTLLTAAMRFQDTKGQPLLGPEITKGRKVWIFSLDDHQAVTAAFLRDIVAETTTFIPSGTAAAGVSSEIKAAGHDMVLWGTPRITNGNHHLFLAGSPIKPIFVQNREPLREVFADMQNSDLARQQDEESIRFKSRKGYGVAVPYATIQGT